MDHGANTLTGCTISGNSAHRAPAAWRMYHGVNTLTACTISGNTASFGGGVNMYNGVNTLTDCTISGNSARATAAALSRTAARPP